MHEILGDPAKSTSQNPPVLTVHENGAKKKLLKRGMLISQCLPEISEVEVLLTDHLRKLRSSLLFGIWGPEWVSFA